MKTTMLGNRVSLLATVCSALLYLSMGHNVQATDVTSPATVIATSAPFVELRQTGDGGMIPAYSWTVESNETEFSVRDLTAGQFPIQVTAGALSNSLRVSTNRRVGLGTSTPQKNLHISDMGGTPTVRFDNGSFVWDVEADQIGFSITDTNAGTTPFTVLQGSGRVGLGILTPATLLHAHKSAESSIAETLARFEVADDALGRLDINNSSSSNATFIPRIQGRSGSSVAALITEGLITTDVGTSPAIVYNAAKIAGGAVVNRPLVVYRNNNTAKVTIAANGDVTATSFITASSRTLKDNIVDLDSGRAVEALKQLKPVEFVYKDDATSEKRVGFIAEDVPEIVATADRTAVPIMDVVALVTRIVKDQQQIIGDQQQRIERQSRSIEAQQKTIDAQNNANSEHKKAMDELMRRLVALESRIPAKE